MKIKLTPELSYLIGFWKELRTKEGIGIRADYDRLAVFSKTVLDLKLTEPGKLLHGEDKVYFYHSAYRKFFQEVVRNEIDRYKYRNDYSASFLAGLFDAVGDLELACIRKYSRMDSMVLNNLNFFSREDKNCLFLTRPERFYLYILPFTKLYKKELSSILRL